MTIALGSAADPHPHPNYADAGTGATFRQSLVNFVDNFGALQRAVHANAKDKGFYDDGLPVNDGEKIALMHTELSESLEAIREGNPPSEKCPDITHAEEEMADVVIRIMDYAEYKGWNIGMAIVMKAAFNRSRPYRHGGKKF